MVAAMGLFFRSLLTSQALVGQLLKRKWATQIILLIWILFNMLKMLRNPHFKDLESK